MSQSLSLTSIGNQIPIREPVVSRLESVAQKIESSGGLNRSFALSKLSTLADLQAVGNDALQRKIIESLQLQKSIEEINQIFKFFERLKVASYEILERVSLRSLDPKTSSVVYALIEEEFFVKTPIQELNGRDDLSVFALRMSKIYQNRPDLLIQLAQTPFSRPWFWQNVEVSVGKLVLLTADDILAIRSQLPVKAFGLLTDVLVKSLDFSYLSTDQIVSCIQGGLGDKATVERRFSILSQEQLTVVFKKVEDPLLCYFPVASFTKLPLSTLTQRQYQELFCSSQIPKEEQRERIAMVTPQAILDIPAQLNLDFFLNKISDEQVRGLDYSKVGPDHLHGIFCSSKLSLAERIRRVALIPNQSLRELVKVAESSLLKHLTGEQILSLDFDALTEDQFKNIFLTSSLEDSEKEAKMGILPIQTAFKAMDRGFYGVLEYLSDQQLAQLDLKDVPSKYIECLFPILDLTKVYRGNYSKKTYPDGTIRHEWQETLPGVSYFASLTEEQVQSYTEKRKETCLRNFKRLSSAQFESIKDKIDPDVLKLLDGQKGAA